MWPVYDLGEIHSRLEVFHFLKFVSPYFILMGRSDGSASVLTLGDFENCFAVRWLWLLISILDESVQWLGIRIASGRACT